MDLVFTEEQQAFRQEVRAFLRQALTPEIMAESHGMVEMHVPAFYRAVAERGWIGLQWPLEYGGQGRSPVDMAIFYEEMGYARAPMGRYNGSVVFVGSSLIAYGSPQQCREYLPRIARGEICCAWGLTEPDSGSDAASIKTFAEERQDGFVVDGQKIFTSGAHLANYILMAVRTRRDVARKQEGLSVLLVPTDAPGLEIRPLWTIAGFRVNQVFLHEVRVSRANLVGEKDQGWRHILTTLDLERSLSAMAHLGSVYRAFDDLMAHLAARTGDPAATRHAAERLLDCRIDLEAARLLCYGSAWLHSRGVVPHTEASVVKVTAAEAALRLAETGMEILGERSLCSGEEGLLAGALEHMYRIAQFHITAGGSNDIQRNIMATRALGLPRH